MAELLLNNGADVNARNDDSEEPLEIAAFYGNETSIQIEWQIISISIT